MTQKQVETPPVASSTPPLNTKGLTPMMTQYLQIKSENKDCLLFYRMGDFYELFFDDALIASNALDITLTKRGKINDAYIPMCGVPVHSGDTYVARLIKNGYRVAICEQIETPEQAKKRGAKEVVKRKIIRIITPGTLTEESLLNARENNYLACLAWVKGAYAVAYADISTGEFYVTSMHIDTIETILSQISPKEILLSEKLQMRSDLFHMWIPYQDCITPIVNTRFDIKNSYQTLCNFYNIFVLDGLGNFNNAHIVASGVLLNYIITTQVNTTPYMKPLKMLYPDSYMTVDMVTRTSLELTQSLQGKKSQTILHSIDRTITGGGARLLHQWLSLPLTNIDAINARLNSIESALHAPTHMDTIRKILLDIPDIERSLNRLSIGRAVPRDILNIKTALSHTGAMKVALNTISTPIFDQCITDLGTHDVLVKKLHTAMRAEPSANIRDGGVIASGFHAELDKMRTLRDENRRIISQLESQYRKQTGIDTLKIKHNNVLQYYIEVTARHSEKIPVDIFIHRQTMKGGLRYTTKELANLSKEILNAKDRALALELEIFNALIDDILSDADAIYKVAMAYATVDALIGLAILAHTDNWIRPVLDNSYDFIVHGGRHPVVEHSLKADDGKQFIANDCILNDTEKIWLLTGPNMAGKSTFLRQNAVIAILAQMGAFVPATHCKIGIIDRVFSRVGAQDDLAHGRSTFMVEMVETATILNQATHKSLVVLDEIGRGTATYDGVSLAWASVEYLAKSNQCRGLFATHYHELNAICDTISTVKPYTMAVKEWQDEVIFLHTVHAGSAKGSYGVFVAKLAGIPPAVITRAEQVLSVLEHGEVIADLQIDTRDTESLSSLPLFDQILQKSTSETKPSALDTYVQDLNIDDISPKEALDILYHIKSLR